MRLIDAIEKAVYQSKPSRLIATVLAMSFVKTGMWYMPNLDTSRVISFNPFRNPLDDPFAQYMFWNWLGPFLAWRLRIHNEHSFLYFHLLFSIAFTCIVVAFIWFHFEDHEARTSLLLFLAFPVSSTAYFWIGMDSLTLLLMALLLVVRKNLWLVLAIGILLGMQHFEQGIVAFGALVLAWVVALALRTKTEYPIRWALASVAGVVLGKIALILIFSHFGIHVDHGRLYVVQHNRELYFGWFYFHFQYVLWAIFGVGWIVVAKYAEWGKSAAPFLIVLLGLMFLAPMVGDETRVLAIVSFPLVAVCLLLNERFLQSLNGRFVAAVAGIWAIIPYPWAWAGIPRVSIFPYDLVYGLHRLFGWFNVPTNQPQWPF